MGGDICLGDYVHQAREANFRKETPNARVLALHVAANCEANLRCIQREIASQTATSLSTPRHYVFANRYDREQRGRVSVFALIPWGPFPHFSPLKRTHAHMYARARMNARARIVYSLCDVTQFPFLLPYMDKSGFVRKEWIFSPGFG